MNKEDTLKWLRAKLVDANRDVEIIVNAIRHLEDSSDNPKTSEVKG